MTHMSIAERQRLQDIVDAARDNRARDVHVLVDTMLSLLEKADRLAAIERKVRELADDLREEIDTHNRMRSFQEYEGGLMEKAISVEERLRAIIDAPDDGKGE